MKTPAPAPALAPAPATVLGRHVWSELMAVDVKRAEAFYVNVIGWSSAPFPHAPNPYIQFKRSDGTAVAGLMERPKDMNMRPFWAMYIAVPDFDEAVADVTRHFGSEMSGVIDIPTVGRIQMLKDPQGAPFYVIQPEPRENPPDREPQDGDASWLELTTTDAAAAMAFYQAVFGWQPADAMDMGEQGTYQMFKRGDRTIGGMMNRPASMRDVPPYWGIYFRVPDITSAVSRIKHNGGEVTNGPTEVPGGDWIVNGRDPDGAAFALHAKRAV
jgi:predicted enzyme related to lactoylglutathione lyase